jgi:hypothetical protein
MIQLGIAAGNVASAELWGQVTLADGTVLPPRLFDKYESIGHKVRRVCRGALKLVGILAILAAATGHVPPEAGAALPAATVITNAGQAIVSNLMSGLGGTVPKYVAWGTGAGTAAAADTTLFTESTEETRTTGTPTRVTTTVTNDTLQIAGTITVATSNKTITNVGLFDATTTGNLYFKSDFTGLALLIGDAIAWTIKIKYT